MHLRLISPQPRLICRETETQVAQASDIKQVIQADAKVLTRLQCCGQDIRGPQLEALCRPITTESMDGSVLLMR